MDDPIVLTGKSKRLKSLDEFQAPYWKGLLQIGSEKPITSVAVVAVGFAAGIVLGLFLIP